jgi:hypothetical protein
MSHLEQLCNDEWLCILSHVELMELVVVIPLVCSRFRVLAYHWRNYTRLRFLARSTDAFVKWLLLSERVRPNRVEHLHLTRCQLLSIGGMQDLARLLGDRSAGPGISVQVTPPETLSFSAALEAGPEQGVQALCFEGCSQLFEELEGQDSDYTETNESRRIHGAIDFVRVQAKDLVTHAFEAIGAGAALSEALTTARGCSWSPVPESRRNCFQWISQIVHHVAHSLKSFSLRFIQPRSWREFKLPLDECVQLVSLELFSVSAFDPLLRNVASGHLTQLRKLVLSDHNMSDSDLLVLLRHNPSLTHVRLTSRTNLDMSVAHLMCARALITLDLSLCYHVSDHTFSKAVEQWKRDGAKEEAAAHLRSLHLDHSAIENDTIGTLVGPSVSERDVKQCIPGYRHHLWAVRGWSDLCGVLGGKEKPSEGIASPLSSPFTPSASFSNSLLSCRTLVCYPFLRSLQELTVQSCHLFGDRSLLLLCATAEALHVVNVCSCPITSESVSALCVLHGSTLRTLSLRGCSEVNTEAVRSIGEYGRALRVLDLGDCRRLTKADLRWLVRRGWSALERLFLDAIVGLDDEVLSWLAQGLLDVPLATEEEDHRKHVSPLDVPVVFQDHAHCVFPSLTFFSMHGAQEVSDEGLRLMRLAYPRLQIIQ